MKRINYIMMMLALVVAGTGCEDLEDTYSDAAGDGRIHYLAKCDDVTLRAGWKSIYVDWTNGLDATIKNVKLTWTVNNVVRDTLLPAGTTSCILKGLTDGTYRVDVCAVNEGKESLVETNYLRPYTESHEMVLAFTQGITKSYRLPGNKFVYFTDTWSENIVEMAMHYTKTDGTPAMVELTEDNCDGGLYTLEDVNTDAAITVSRRGKIEECVDTIEFVDIVLSKERMITSDFKTALLRRYNVSDKDDMVFNAFIDTVRVLEFDYDLTTLEDILYCQKLEKVVFGRNRYISEDGADAMNGVDRNSVLREQEKGLQVLTLAHEQGVTVERYAEHYFPEYIYDEELWEDVPNPYFPDFLEEMGYPELPELNYLTTSDVDTIMSNQKEMAGYVNRLPSLVDNDPATAWLPSSSSVARTFELTIKLKEEKLIKGVKIAQAYYEDFNPWYTPEDYFPASVQVTVSTDELTWRDLTHMEENLLGRVSGEATLLPNANPDEPVRFIRVKVTDQTVYGTARLRIGDIVPYY